MSIRTFKDLNNDDDNGDDKKKTWFVGGGKDSGQAVLPNPEQGLPGVDPAIARRIQQQQADSSSQGAENRVRLIMWSSGHFSVDGGATVRDGQSDADKIFMECLKNGRVPPELGHGDVDIVVEHKKEPYVAPAPGRAVGGGGNNNDPHNSIVTIPAPLELTPGEPVVRVAVALAAGGRHTVEVNRTTTVKQLRGHVATLLAAPAAVKLTARGPPPRVLDNDHVSVEAAGIVNAVVMQS
eukprot:PhM_4_TR4992/c0_g1_i1/m.73200/K14012/SHP1, UBX1, NSFL1C; UBX domain-containing protein 1